MGGGGGGGGAVRSVATRNPLNCWLASFRSNGWCARSLKISRRTSVSRDLQWWLSRKPARLTSWVFSKTQTWVRHPRQASYHHVEGYSACAQDPRWTRLSDSATKPTAQTTALFRVTKPFESMATMAPLRRSLFPSCSLPPSLHSIET